MARRRDRAIVACEAAAKLDPSDAEMHYRLGMLLRTAPGRLQEAIQHFNGCLLANDSYPGVRDAQEEAVGRMNDLKKEPRGWVAFVSNLVPVLMLLAVSTHFMLR